MYVSSASEWAQAAADTSACAVVSDNVREADAGRGGDVRLRCGVTSRAGSADALARQ